MGFKFDIDEEIELTFKFTIKLRRCTICHHKEGGGI